MDNWVHFIITQCVSMSSKPACLLHRPQQRDGKNHQPNIIHALDDVFNFCDLPMDAIITLDFSTLGGRDNARSFNSSIYSRGSQWGVLPIA